MRSVYIARYLSQRCKEMSRDKLCTFLNAKKNIGFAGTQPVQAQEIQAVTFRQALAVEDIAPCIKSGQSEVIKSRPEIVLPSDDCKVPAFQTGE